MNRRDFLKKSALVTAGAAVAAPVTAVLKTAESAGLIDSEQTEIQQVIKKDGKMEVLLINGSPRHNGNTFASLSEASKQLQKYGIETEIFQIGIKPVRFCLNCGGCRKENSGKCVYDDDVCNEIIAKIQSSDALIVGAPVYYGQPNGGLLSVMQRVFYAGGRFVQNKPAAAVAVCRRGGATAAFQSMNMMFQMMNMPVVTSQYWNIVYGASKGEAQLDDEGMQTMRTLASNMAWLLKKIHDSGSEDYPQREPWKMTNFIR